MLIEIFVQKDSHCVEILTNKYLKKYDEVLFIP